MKKKKPEPERLPFRKIGNIMKYKFLRFLIFFILAAIGPADVNAQEKTITASAPSVVTAGQPFNYTISGDFDGKVSLPEMKGLRVVGGPSTFVSQQASNSSGRLQMVRQVSYSYTIIAEEEGEFVIPPAKIISGRKELVTNEVKVKAIKGTQQAQPANPSPDAGSDESSGAASIFARLMPSRKSVYVGEQLVVTSRIFTREALQIASVKISAFEGFWKEDLKGDENPVRDNYNGQSYLTLAFGRYLLTAQKPGEIRLSPMEVNCLVQKKVQSRGPSGLFDDPFFNDPFFDRVQTVEQSVRSNELVLNVKPLPANAPEGFAGGVGSFTMNTIIDKETAKVNDAITLKLTISGKGNLNLIKPVKIDFPPDLELFDPKSTQNVNHSADGTTGSVSFEYVVIPRHAGNYRISPVIFSYFDPATEKYLTLHSDEFNFTVEKSGEQDESFISAPGIKGEQGQIMGSKSENVVSLAKDILFIKLTPPHLRKTGNVLFGSVFFNLTFALSAFLFLGLIIIRKERIRRNADLNAVRNRKARKLAERRLMNAHRLLKANDEGFYEEILKVLWGYLSDKLGVNISELSRDLINKKLQSLSVPENLLEDLWKVIDDCEFARYGTGFAGDKTGIYNSTVKLISGLQENIK